MKRNYSSDEKLAPQWKLLRKGDTLVDVPMEKYNSTCAALSLARAATDKNWTTTVNRETRSFSVRRVK